MKKISLLLLLSLAINVGNAQSKSKISINESDYKLFGEKFSLTHILTENQMLKKYKSLKQGDSIAIKFVSTIKNVCKKKGCWMNLVLDKNSDSFVKFKDYGFFMPLNCENSIAIVNGYAFVEIVTISELKHYAKDAGKLQTEIDKITKPEITYAFKASGVYLK
jgi:hypothetical protein